MTTIKDIAQEFRIEPYRARARLRAAGVKRPGNRWVFKSNSPQERRVRKILAHS